MRRLLPLMLGILASGCATGRGAFDGLIIDQEAIITEIAAVTAPGDQASTNERPMKIPNMEASFCLQRALDNVSKAKANTAWDTIFIVSAGVSLTYGAAAGAASSALPKNTEGKVGLQVSSVTSVAAAAGILALRTALSLSDVARTQRIAAARNVDAALTIFQHYAMADDLTEGTNDGFATCRDGDIEVAGALAGTKVNDALQKQTQSVAEAKDAKKEATTSAAVAAESVTKLESAVAKTQADVSAKVEDTVNSAATSTAAAPVKEKVATARTAIATVAVEQKKLTIARAAAALAPPATARDALKEVKVQDGVVMRAQLDASAKAKDAADAAAPALTAKGAAVVEATKALIAEQDKLSEAELQAAAKKAEAALKTAQADVAQKKLDMLTAATRFRKAIFFQTSVDVSLARKMVLMSLDDLTASKAALAKLQEQL